MTPATQAPAALTEEAALREIEGFVREAAAHLPDADGPAPPADVVPDLETVARDLGITVEALRAIRETTLG